MFSESGDLYDLIYTALKDYAAEAASVAQIIRTHRHDALEVLDVACGTGEHARHLSATHGFHVDGIDIDPVLVGHARAKNPGRRFEVCDMMDFDLGRRYDAVLCLFSSIGYAVTLDRVLAVLTCVRRHLRPAGVMLVEPWFEPGVLQDGYLTLRTAETATTKIARVSRNEVVGRVSRLRFEYLVADASGIRHLVEYHELGLFTRTEMESAFSRAGLRVAFEESGPSGRGLYVASDAGAE
jgi:SAM-dependent methyltransferase